MADLADVERALVGIVAGGLFPNTTYLPGAYAASSVTGVTTKIYRGWPESSNLDADLAAGQAHVSVFSEAGVRNTSRYQLEWRQSYTNAPTVTATVSGQTVTIGGTVSAGQVVGVSYGTGAARHGVAYRVLATDTLATVAAGLAAAATGATASGAVVTFPAGDVSPVAMVLSDQMAAMEVRRQEQRFRISCWCPTPAVRDAAAGAVDAAFAGLLSSAGYPTQFITLADAAQSAARVRYMGVTVNDTPAKDRVWRRDLVYSVEYATHLANLQPEMMFDILNATNASGALFSVGTLHP